MSRDGRAEMVDLRRGPGSAEEVDQFRRRQISRMSILGATAENKPLLEESYHRILAAFEPNVGMSKYLFGSRPSLADFAWFGQLSELATDPTPMQSCGKRHLSPIIGHGGWMTLPVSTGRGIRANRRCLE